MDSFALCTCIHVVLIFHNSAFFSFGDDRVPLYATFSNQKMFKDTEIFIVLAKHQKTESQATISKNDSKSFKFPHINSNGIVVRLLKINGNKMHFVHGFKMIQIHTVKIQNCPFFSKQASQIFGQTKRAKSVNICVHSRSRSALPQH